VSRNAPVLDEEDVGRAVAPSSSFQKRLDRRAKQRRRDVVVVGVMTPALVVVLIVGLLVTSQLFYPDTYVEPTVEPTATLPPFTDKPTPVPVAEPIDTARLNAGVVDKPPPLEWPDVDGFKTQVDPGRPSEHADYVPDLANVDTRRLLTALTVNIVFHTSPPFASGAAEELAKPYPLRARKQKVLDFEASTGYVPDDSIFGVVFSYGDYRVQIEAVPQVPPIKPGQRADVEYQALHLADHITRRLQESATSGHRTGAEATAVHLRDHIARMVPFGH